MKFFTTLRMGKLAFLTLGLTLAVQTSAQTSTHSPTPVPTPPPESEPTAACQATLKTVQAIADRFDQLCTDKNLKGIEQLVIEAKVAGKACETACVQNPSIVEDCKAFPSDLEEIKKQCEETPSRLAVSDLAAALISVDSVAKTVKPSTESKKGDGIVGHWSMKKAECVTSEGVKHPQYEASIDLRLAEKTFVGVGRVASFQCRLAGTYSYHHGEISYSINDTGGCPVGEALNGGFSADVDGSHMTVHIGGDAAGFICGEPGKIRLRLSRHQ